MPTPGPPHQCRHPAPRGAQRRRAVDRRHPADGDQPRLVPRPVRRGPLVGRPGRPGRHRRLHRVVPRPGRQPAHHRRRVRHRPPRADPVDQPAADPGPGPHDGRRGRGRGRRTSPRPGRSRRCARRCCATRGRSRSRPREVYAEAAEARGAWDARLESLVVDAVLRGEADDSMQSRAAALGWGTVSHVAVVAGRTPRGSSAGVVDGCAGAPHGCRWSAGGRAGPPAGGHPRRRRANRWQRGAVAGRRLRGRARRRRADRARTCSRPAGRRGPPCPGCRCAAPGPTRPGRSLADDLLPERVLAGDAARPPRCWSTASTGPWWPPAASLLETASGLPRGRRRARGHGAGAVRPPQHGALPAGPDRGPSPATT